MLRSKLRQAAGEYGNSIASDKYSYGRTAEQKLIDSIKAVLAFEEGAKWAFSWIKEREKDGTGYIESTDLSDLEIIDD